jgi:hypothetical protein
VEPTKMQSLFTGPAWTGGLPKAISIGPFNGLRDQ